MKREHDKENPLTLSELIFLIAPLGLVLVALHFLLGHAL